MTMYGKHKTSAKKNVHFHAFPSATVVRIFKVGLSGLAVGGAMFISQPDIIIPLKKRRAP